MKLKSKLEKERKKYLNQWKGDSKFFYDKGLYNWMCSSISNSKRVLEIGCGSGLSTLSLIENGHNIIAIDENIQCLNNTKKLLESRNIKVKLIKRETLFIDGTTYYEYKFNKIKYVLKEDEVLLIESDIINDNNLEEWLNDIEIDCVVCWLIGSHGARRFNKYIKDGNINTPGEYRITVQNKVYEVSDKILKRNGILHLVDRVKMPENEEEKKLFRESHEEQASVTDLVIENIDFKQYSHDINNGVEMSTEDDNKVYKQDKLHNVALSSVICRKP